MVDAAREPGGNESMRIYYKVCIVIATEHSHDVPRSVSSRRSVLPVYPSEPSAMTDNVPLASRQQHTIHSRPGH